MTRGKSILIFRQWVFERSIILLLDVSHELVEACCARHDPLSEDQGPPADNCVAGFLPRHVYDAHVPGVFALVCVRAVGLIG